MSKTLNKLVAATVMLAASMAAVAAFKTDMSAADVKKEISARVNNGEDLAAIFEAAKTAGVSTETVAQDLFVLASAKGSKITTDAVETAARGAGLSDDQVAGAKLSALPATASGGDTGGGTPGGGGTTGSGGFTSTGGSTFGGGGGGGGQLSTS